MEISEIRGTIALILITISLNMAYSCERRNLEKAVVSCRQSDRNVTGE